MNKKYNLKLDLQFRCNNSIMKFNQFDNNTSDFFMRITNGGNLVDIEKAIVVLAIIKPSGKVASQFAEVENGLVYADLKPNMRDEIGIYTAQAMLVLEDERVVTDVISYEVKEDKIFSLLNDTVETAEDFTLLTDMLNRLSTIEISEEQRVINEAERILSEENRKIEESKRIEAELIRQHEEADRAKYDATRESNENIRKQNESTRLANETNRIDEEAKRVEEENKRKLAEEERNANYNFMTEDEERRRLEANAHKEAEKLRAQAENTRVNEEAKRRTTEQARVSAENTRVSNENTRKANEATRQNNETKRVETETQRQNRYNSFIADAEANASNFENYTNSAKIKEEERKSNELNRKSQEDRRVSNEVERISNENTRKANEAVREKNETSRQYVFENKVDEVDKKIVEINTTKDNFVSNISTKVDTKISEIDNVKDNFVSSVNTKVDSKISELDTAKSDMTNTVSNKVNEVEARFNALTSKQQQDAEVIDARDGETSLKARLDRDIEKAKQVYVNVEGSSISTDSSVGYLKDIEILGNTIQNASNLADIKSVGDKVEGQELYEIPVLSCGKNLFSGYSTKIRVKRGTYRLTSKQTPGANRINFKLYDYKMNDITQNSIVESNGGFYLTSSGGYNLSSDMEKLNITMTLSNDNVAFIEFKYQAKAYIDIQLEEGTVATPYEPYVEDKLTILSPTQPEKVGDVADRIIEKDGVWGVEKNVYTATSDYFFQSSNKQLWYLSKSKSPSWVSKNIWNEISNMVICNYYSEVATYNDVLLTEGIFIDHKGATPNIIIGTNDININSLPSDLIVKYQLATPQFIPLPHDQQVKLRTFAGKTNISFLTEIEGTIKAQVPKSLGATVNTHTEQINNLNKELDRVKKLEESTVSTVTTESDFTTVEQTTNGYFEDVKLEGKTLVNLSDINAFSISGAGVSIHTNIDKIKPNTTYTRIVYITKNTLVGTNEKGMVGQLNDGERVILNKDIQIAQNFVGLLDCSKYTISDITREKLSSVRIFSVNTGGVLEGYEIILEGDHTQNPPSGYIEGLKSVGQDVEEVSVESVKGDGNLFSSEYWEYGFISDGTGIHTQDNNYVRTKKIMVTPNTTYSFKGYSRRIYYYDITGEFISKFDIGGGTFLEQTNRFTTPSNCHYIALRYDITHTNAIIKTLDEMKLYNTVICKGDFREGLRFEADKKRLLYYNEETQTWEKPILREWDSIEKHANDKYYYHVRSKEGDYVEGDESLNDCITDLTVSVKKLAEEKVYECTNIDLITYANETNYIVECGAISPKTTLKVHNNISNVVSLLQKKVSLLESDVTSYMITQNRLMLASRYNADTVSFKVDVASFSDTFEYDNDLYELILNNILVGKDNYNREYIENLTRFYWMDFVISDEMYSTLFEIIEEQHNPKIEEETPLI